MCNEEIVFMRLLFAAILLVGLSGCSQNRFDIFENDLKNTQVSEFSYNVGEYQSIRCVSSAGQKVLKEWVKTLKENNTIASWPDPHNYLVLSFNNMHKYKIRIFSGTDEVNYSLIRMNKLYIGERLNLESVCSGLKAHNKSLSSDALRRAG